MLRIDVDSQPGGAPYGVPAGASGNPFAGNPLCNVDGSGAQACPEIYALGFRNPVALELRLASRAISGSATSARATGKRSTSSSAAATTAGTSARARTASSPRPAARPQDLIDPVAEYGHDLGFSITGGHVYRGLQTTQVAGNYVFADFGGMIAWLAARRRRRIQRRATRGAGLRPAGRARVAADFLVRGGPRRGAVPARLRPWPDPASSCSRTEERANPALYSVGGSAGGMGMGLRALGLTGLAVALLGCGDGDPRATADNSAAGSRRASEQHGLRRAATH